MENNNVPIWHKINLTVEEAAIYSNIGENRIRNYIGDKRCPFALHIGKKTLIKREAFEEFIKEKDIM